MREDTIIRILKTNKTVMVLVKICDTLGENKDEHTEVRQNYEDWADCLNNLILKLLIQQNHLPILLTHWDLGLYAKHADTDMSKFNLKNNMYKSDL